MAYTGTSITQDGRFSNKEKKLLRTRQWPDCFDRKVNIAKVEMNVIEKWINDKVEEILGFEDEIVVNLAVAELTTDQENGICPKKIQLNLTGFLEKHTPEFMRELWMLLLEA